MKQMGLDLAPRNETMTHLLFSHKTARKLGPVLEPLVLGHGNRGVSKMLL